MATEPQVGDPRGSIAPRVAGLRQPPPRGRPPAVLPGLAVSGQQADRWVLLYRTPDCWRFSVSLTRQEGIGCGRLDHPGPEGSAEAAQEAIRLLVEEIEEHPVALFWEPSERPDRWHGVVL